MNFLCLFKKIKKSDVEILNLNDDKMYDPQVDLLFDDDEQMDLEFFDELDHFRWIDFEL